MLSSPTFPLPQKKNMKRLGAAILLGATQAGSKSYTAGQKVCNLCLNQKLEHIKRTEMHWTGDTNYFLSYAYKDSFPLEDFCTKFP